MLVRHFASSSGCHRRVFGTLGTSARSGLRVHTRPVADTAKGDFSCAAASNSNGHPPSMNGNSTQNVQHGTNNGTSSNANGFVMNGHNGNGAAKERFSGKTVLELQDWLVGARVIA